MLRKSEHNRIVPNQLDCSHDQGERRPDPSHWRAVDPDRVAEGLPRHLQRLPSHHHGARALGFVKAEQEIREADNGAAALLAPSQFSAGRDTSGANKADFCSRTQKHDVACPPIQQARRV